MFLLPTEETAPAIAVSLKRFLVYDRRRAEINQLGRFFPLGFALMRFADS